MKYTEAALQALIFTVLLMAAGYFGGVTLFASKLITTGASLLALLVLGGIVITRTPLPRPTATLAVAALITIIWAGIQSIPLPQSLQFLANPIWKQTSSALGIPLKSAISVNPTTTLTTLLTGIAYLGWGLTVAWATAYMGSRRMLRAIALAGIIICAYGFLIYIFGNNYVLFLPKTVYLESLSATFINRNTFATFAGLTLLANMAVILEKIGDIHQSQSSRRQKVNLFINTCIKAKYGWIASFVMVFMTLILSGSRAGIAWTLIGLLLMGISLLRNNRYITVIFVTVLALGSLMFLNLIGDVVSQRMATLNVDAGARLLIYQTSLMAWWNHPLLGTGLGTFEDAFRAYRPIELSMGGNIAIDRAHSTPIQLLLELGAIGMSGIVALVFLTARTLLKGVRTRRRQVIYPALGLGAFGLVLGHSFFDFSLEIPGVTLFAIAIISFACVKSFRAPEEEKQAPTTHLYLSCALVFIMAFGSALAADNLWKYWHYSAPLRVLDSAAAKSQTIPTAQLNLISGQLTSWKAEPTVASRLAIINTDLAQRATNPAVKNVFYEVQGLYAREALSAKPLDPYTWHRLSLAEANLGHIPQAIAFWKMSNATGQWEALAWGRIPYLQYLSRNVDASDKQLIAETVHQLWNAAPYTTWSLYRADPSTMGFIACTIQADEPAVKVFEKQTGTPVQKYLNNCQ